MPVTNSDNVISVAKASDWRRWKKEGYLLKFPSGNAAYVRPVSLDMMLETQYVPNDLISQVESMLDANRNGASSGANVSEIARTSKAFSSAAVYASFVNPRVVENPVEEDEISPDDLDPEDVAFLVKWIGQPTTALRKFCQQQSEGLDPVPPFDADLSKTESNSEAQSLVG